MDDLLLMCIVERLPNLDENGYGFFKRKWRLGIARREPPAA